MLWTQTERGGTESSIRTCGEEEKSEDSNKYVAGTGSVCVGKYRRQQQSPPSRPAWIGGKALPLIFPGNMLAGAVKWVGAHVALRRECVCK